MRRRAEIVVIPEPLMQTSPGSAVYVAASQELGFGPNTFLYRIRAFVIRVAVHLELPYVPRVVLRRRNKGIAYPHMRLVVLPLVLLELHDAFWKCYVIHELCHFRQAGPRGECELRCHGAAFRDLERSVCAQFGYAVTYRGSAYLSEILDNHTGKPLCDGYGNVV
jgi:hypothetical protein